MRIARAVAGGLAAAALAAALYARTLAPTVGAGDSGELILAAQGLGIAHPPGYPLWLLFARLFASVPWDSLALRVNAFSALSTAAGVGLFWLLALRAGLRAPAAAFATGLFGTATIVWQSAVQAEVYGLATAAFLALVLLALRARRSRAGFRDEALFCFAAGLAPVAHQTLFFPALLLACWVLARRGLDLGRCLRGAAWAIAGASITLVIPVRSSAAPAYAWTQVHGLSGLADYLLRRTYGGLAQNGFRVDRAFDEAAGMALLLAGSIGWIGSALAIGGALNAGRRRATLAAIALPALTIPVALMALLAFTPDAEHFAQIAPFLTPVVAAAALLAGSAAEGCIRRIPRGRRPIVFAVLAACILVPLPGRYAAADRSGFDLPERYGRDLLSYLPRGATLVLDGDNETFLTAYLTRHAGIRPDVVLIHRRGYLFGDPYGLRGKPRSEWSSIARRVDLERLRRNAAPVCYSIPPADLVEAGVPFTQRGLVYVAHTPGAKGWRGWEVPIGWPRSSDLLRGAPERYDYVARKLAVSYSDAAARSLWSRGRIDEALPWFQDAARVAFDVPGAHLNLATAAAAAGKPDIALDELLHACRLAPYDPEPPARLALFLAAAGRPREAARWFERAFRAAPGPELAADAARAWSLAGERERAETWSRRAASWDRRTEVDPRGADVDFAPLGVPLAERLG